jgi:hypothetical protein
MISQRIVAVMSAEKSWLMSITRGMMNWVSLEEQHKFEHASGSKMWSTQNEVFILLLFGLLFFSIARASGRSGVSVPRGNYADGPDVGRHEEENRRLKGGCRIVEMFRSRGSRGCRGKKRKPQAS